MTPGVDDVHHIMETTVYSTSTVLNIYLLYLITYHSTFGIKLYKYLLTVDAGLDLIFGFIVLLSQPVGFSCDGYFVMKLNGFVAGFSPGWDSFFGILYLFFLNANVMWIPVQFVYRYLLLCKDSIHSLKTNVLIATFTIFYSLLCLVIIVIMCEVREEYQTVGKQIIEKNGWPMRSDQRPTYVVGSFIAICPLIAITIPVYYFCTVFAFQLCSGWISAYITSALSAITVINPLTTIFCFRCYRRAALKHFTCDQLKKTIRPSNSIAVKSDRVVVIE
ncbi:serpentine type 7TM GPCR chemoreceptor str domain-containing protein [Ditylenchus destructor]|uniref:Serpentine type 7TM GPCR chemoreceptor str domain-containing protein n=1 Tax=Ditylenchus destructor TaxID=166010 RepID=A0AAD4MI81_9BILA|nr:serpentine type 7TM GPCR chemoreceptor str domain-containing protein [Ditylenchus destructor]